MTVRIAVVDPLPLFQQGMAAALADLGHPVDLPDDILAWRRSARAVVMLTLQAERDWNLLRRLRAEWPAVPVVVLLDDSSGATGVRAMRAGALSVLPRAVAAPILRRTVQAVLDGQAVLPAEVAAALVTAAADPPGVPPALSGDQLAWLRQLADGATVAQLANRAGYSERAMFRLLRGAYERIGVRSRIEAIMYARDAGWL